MSEEQNKANSSLLILLSNVFRAVTRPTITVIFAVAIARVVVEGIDAPEWFITLAIGCIAWWFGDRTVQHIKEKKEQS